MGKLAFRSRHFALSPIFINKSKVKTENIFGQSMNAWDVKTNKNKWWVITNPTNLYSQELFPSLDYTFSFHIGVTTRMQQSHITQQQLVIHDDIEELWNKIALIQDRFLKSKNVEDFQEIGIKCRECLLLLMRKISDNSMIPSDVEIPQKANFILWSEHIARHYFPGSSKEKVRSHFKDLSKSTWQLTNWLTHSHSSEKTDAMLTVGATEHILEIFIAARANHESKNKEE